MFLLCSACRSEYFRALFRCSLSEGADSCLHLDSSQHNASSIHALVRFLYFGDLKVDPSVGVYLSNCTDFFGLSSSALEHACQELVSQHHCLKVLRAAWKSANEGLFKRACKFIDWSTLAALMNGSARAGEEEDEDAEEQHEDEDDELHMDDEEDEDEEQSVMEDDEAEQAHMAGADVPAGVVTNLAASFAAAAAAAATSASSSSTSSSSSLSTRMSRSRASSSPARTAPDPSDVAMWQAIVAEKAAAGSAAKQGGNKRNRSM